MHNIIIAFLIELEIKFFAFQKIWIHLFSTQLLEVHYG